MGGMGTNYGPVVKRPPVEEQLLKWGLEDQAKIDELKAENAALKERLTTLERAAWLVATATGAIHVSQATGRPMIDVRILLSERDALVDALRT